MPKTSLIRNSVSIALVIAGLSASVSAQKQRPELPLVVAGEIPFYPLIARAARVQGVVKIKVTTDGKKIASVDVESGPPMLVRFAKANILTWKFAKHKPETFTTTFEYVLEKPAQCGYTNDILTLKLPLEVRLTANIVETCDPAGEIGPHH